MGVSLREYARMRGVSHTAVVKAVSAGRITTEPDGSIDPKTADALWDKNTRPRGDSGEPATDASRATGTGGAPDYKVSRAIREAYAARLAKLDFEEKSGKLVSVDEVKIATFTMARQARDRLLQIPRKLAPVIVAEVSTSPEPRVVEEILSEAIREALEGLPG